MGMEFDLPQKICDLANDPFCAEGVLKDILPALQFMFPLPEKEISEGTFATTDILGECFCFSPKTEQSEVMKWATGESLTNAR